MAAAGAHLPPWDKRNVHEGGLFIQSPYKEILNEARIKLRDNLRLDDIWAHLRKLDVLSRNDEERIRLKTPNCDTVDELLRFIERCQRWHYHALMRAIALSGQGYLIPRGELPPEVYTENIQGVPQGSADVCKTSLSSDLLRAIHDHCKASDQYLMQSALFAFDDDPTIERIDISKCYIEVEACFKTGDRLNFEVAEEDIFGTLGDHGPPRTVLLYGGPGQGKTTFAKHIVQSNCKNYLQNDDPLQPKNSLWRLMIYLHAQDIKSTVEEAVRDKLWCKEPDVKLLLDYALEGDEVAIVIDAIDEVRNSDILGKLKDYVHFRHKRGGPTILITARTHLCPISTADFDRFLVLKGITIEQGIDYVNHYREAYIQAECEGHYRVIDYVNNHRERLNAVLTNPLRLHIFCALALRGELELDEDCELSIPKLFGPLERYLTTREGGKVTAEQSKAFYRLCLYGLLSDLREFPERLLTSFNIVENYYVFLEKTERQDEYGAWVSYYSFGHEMIYEYFASCYIRTLSAESKLSLIMSICSRKSLRNVQLIMFQLLAQEEETDNDLLQTMIRSILIFQFGESKWTLSKTLYDLMHLSEKIETTTILEDMLCPNQEKHLIRNISSICQKINRAFDEYPYILRDASWFSNLQSNGTDAHVADCLKLCPSPQREKISKSTYLHMLPSRSKWTLGYPYTVVAVGTTHWAGIRRRFSTMEVSAWSPTECEEAIAQGVPGYSRFTHLDIQEIWLSVTNYSHIWGKPPLDVWSSESWGALLTKVISVWPGRDVHIWLADSTPMKGFLNCLSDAGFVLFLCGHIEISYGKVKLEELLTHFRKAIAPLSVAFHSPYIVVPTCDCIEAEDTLIKKRDSLCDMFNFQKTRMLGIRPPRWVTETDEEYVWPDQLDSL